MSSIFTKLAIGVDWSGGSLDLVALGRRFRRFVVIDQLHLFNPLEEESRGRVSEFLNKNRIREARVIACLPREALLVRFLDLPGEAEPQLARVVGYQIDALHPFEDAQVYWDCAVLARDSKTRQIRVMVVLAQKSRLEWHKQVLRNLGLRLNSLTLAAAALAPWLKSSLPNAALVLSGRASSVELLAFQEGSLCATQEIPLDPSESAAERLERELHQALSSFALSDPATLPVFVGGAVPSAFSVSNLAELPSPKLRLAQPPNFDLKSHLPALAAAYQGLVRSPAVSINLLPPEERWQPHRKGRVPAYALGTTAALLALLATAHGWIERALYARALDRQVLLLKSPAEQVRRQAQEANALAARAALLDGLRTGTWQKLRILQELTRLLPDGTWLQQVQLSEETVEIYGYSNRAADLVPPLENSPYFSQVEFTSPIVRDSRNKETFRIRMRLKQPARL